MTINFIFRNKKNPANLYCRLTNGRSTNLISPINIYLDPGTWNSKKQCTVNNHTTNKSLTLLRLHLIDTFNDDFMNGNVIDTSWLKKCISDFFNRPKHEVRGKNLKHNIYYTSFIDWWLDNKAAYWLTSSSNYMNKREQKKYSYFSQIVKEFEGKEKIKFSKLSNKTIAKFSFYLHDTLNYSENTIQRHIGRFKFFCLRAEEENIELSKSYKQRVYILKSEKIKEPYLNENEIQKVYNYNFSYSDKLDNARDNLIIAVWTGLRVSDFLKNLNTTNFIDDFIEIITQKTRTPVIIPIHPMVKNILIKRNGKLPSKTSDSKFNKDVKEICHKVGLNKVIKGKLYDTSKKRKIIGMYKKYELVSSHIGRRSFVSNLIGKIDDSVIMAIGGWSSKKMMYNYVKKTNLEYAEKLKDLWHKH